jgi:hypothetical protein
MASTKAKRFIQEIMQKNPAQKDLGGFIQRFQIEGKIPQKMILALESRKEGETPKEHPPPKKRRALIVHTSKR